MHTPHTPNGAIVLNFGKRGVIADVITHAKFFVNRFHGFGRSDAPKFCYLHRIGWSILQQCKHCRSALCFYVVVYLCLMICISFI